jgi:type I restriction enzyme S subunit
MITDGWREIRLGDYGSTFGGLTGKSAKDFGTGESSFVTFMNVISNVLLKEDGTELVDVKAGEAQAQLRPGDLIFNGSSETPEEVGFAAVVPRELDGVYLNSFCFGFRCTPDAELDPKFFAYLTRSAIGRDVIRPMAQGSTRYNLAKTNLLNGRFVLPSKNEQQAIADALSDADALVESLDALIAKKRDMKQAAMQQLLTGRTRLPGFDDEWQQKSVGECLTIRHGRNQSMVVDVNGEYPILGTGGEIGRASAFLYDKPSVLIGRKGTIDRPQYMETPFWTVDTLFYSEVKSGFEPRFMYYVFLTIDWRSMNEASGVPSLNASTIEAVPVSIPRADEQRAIAVVLADMDAEIDALVAQREKADLVKQGMMQELLSGRVRLV